MSSVSSIVVAAELYGLVFLFANQRIFFSSSASNSSSIELARPQWRISRSFGVQAGRSQLHGQW